LPADEKEKSMNRRAIAAVIFFAVCLFLYMENMAPSYNSDDSPETTVAYKTLGIQHPPGYPLATLTGKIFTLIPAGSVAFRSNMAAVVLNLLAAFAVYLLAVRVFGMAPVKAAPGLIEAAALTAAALYVFSSSSWLQGSIAKGSIYALNSLLLCLCLLSLFKLEDSRRYLYLFALLYGLSMCNHWTSMMAAAPGVVYYLVMKRKSLKPRHFAIASLFFALGLFAYIYVPVRNAGNPVYAWGDVRSVKDLLWLVSRAQYSGMEVRHSFSDTLGLLKFYLKNLFTFEYPWPIALAVLPGAAALAFYLPAEGGALAIAFVMLVAGVASLATPPPNTEWITKPYLVSTNIFAGIFVSFALFFILSAVKKASIRSALSWAALIAFSCVMIVTGRPDYSRYYIGYDYSKNLAKSLSSGCVFFTEGDMNVGASLYLTLVDGEKFAPVIPVVSAYPWYVAQLKRNYGAFMNFPDTSGDVKSYIAGVIDGNKGKDFFYSNVFTKELVENRSIVPEGIVYRIIDGSKREVITDMYMKFYSLRGIIGDRIRYDEFTRRLVVENYAMAYFNIADILRNAGDNAAAGLFYEKGLFFYENHGAFINAGLSYYMSGRFDRALEMWQKALESGPNDPVVYSNIGFIYASTKDYAKAREYVNKALILDPANQTALKLSKSLENKGASK
jgi:tetratricopeptide (TPR) repeat protein